MSHDRHKDIWQAFRPVSNLQLLLVMQKPSLVQHCLNRCLCAGKEQTYNPGTPPALYGIPSLGSESTSSVYSTLMTSGSPQLPFACTPSSHSFTDQMVSNPTKRTTEQCRNPCEWQTCLNSAAGRYFILAQAVTPNQNVSAQHSQGLQYHRSPACITLFCLSMPGSTALF